ncbi:15848_t:CDS:10, partial [Dentiscutata erythropus]
RNSILSEKVMNEPTTKRSKHSEDSKDKALQQLYWLHPDLNGQTWIKTLSSKRFFKGKKSALATIFLKPNCNETNIGQILKGKDYTPYFKNFEIVTLLSIKDILKTMIYDDVELTGINLTEGEGFLYLVFFETNMKNELYIKKASYRCREPIKCTIFVNGLEDNIPKARFEQATYLQGDHMYSNFIGPVNEHEIIANLENKGLDNEAYRRIDCTLLALAGNICANSKIVQKAQKTIRIQKELVESLRNRLKLKFEAEEEQVSEPLISIVHNVVDEVLNEKHENISNVILKELVHVQSKKPKGKPFCIQAMKSVIQMPSLSTLKSYINETEQHTGWQDKVVKRIVANMEANNVWGYARLGFFSHDLFKIQKGLLWSQRDNRYVGYVDFDNENAEFEAFGEQCFYKIQGSECTNNHIKHKEAAEKKDQERTLATQIHQIVWHSVSHSFNFPIAYFGVETISVHTLNTILFNLAAKLECVAIHTCGSVKTEDTLRALIGLQQLGSLTIPMPKKIIWNVGDQYKVRNTHSNKWYPGKVLTEISVDNYLDIEVMIETTEKVELYKWRSLLHDIRPAYDENEHCVSHIAINPVTGNKWFFLNDPTHVFKKLRNNVSKSHTSNDGTKIKMRVDLAKHTLSFDVKKAIANIPELNHISQGTQLFIHYARMYRDITHSRICISSLEDPRLNTLKEIKQWFIQGNKQKKDSSQWFSTQYQFDLILSINRFLEIVEYVLTNWPGAIIQPRRLSQDMLEGLFGSIREMAGDSSTHTVQSYGYAMNKLIITMQMTSEIQSLNYGLANGSGCVLADLKRRDYRTTVKPNEQNLEAYNRYKIQIEMLSTFSYQIFQELLNDDLLLYKDGIENLLVTWSKNIHQMALDSVPQKKYIYWLTIWSTNLESRLNNYKCAGDWFNDFQWLAPDDIKVETQRLIAYILLEKIIRITFRQIIPGKIIDLEPAEVSKFQYIIRWTIYKLTKSDRLTLAHEEFAKIKSCLNVLSSEQVEYICDTRSKMTIVIPGADFIQFMYYLESLIFQLFEKHIEYGPDILIYINNNLVSNRPLKKQFNDLLQIAYEFYCNAEYKNKELFPEFIHNSIQLSQEAEDYLLVQKGSSCLRENVKAMGVNLKNNAKKDDQPKTKLVIFKKRMLPENLELALGQLKIWA